MPLSNTYPQEKEIIDLFKKWKGQALDKITPLQISGSNRSYFRIYFKNQSYIGTYNEHIQENTTFIYFSRYFISQNIPVPNIYMVHPQKTSYIQEDLGSCSLLQLLEEKGYVHEVYDYFKQSLSQLAYMQIKGHQALDYHQCIATKIFGKESIISDLLYFKYYFLDPLQIPYDKQDLLKDFDKISALLSPSSYQYFMFRDFQSRNIMIHHEKPYFIDYQGGMMGNIQYDVASLLWQAKANLPEEWKHTLFQHYTKEVQLILSSSLDIEKFTQEYNGLVFIRLLQVLGAYGFRGLFERKAHFLTSIPLALRNLQLFMNNVNLPLSIPTFQRILEQITSPSIIKKYTPQQITKEHPLQITIESFSYRNSIPPDPHGNGGGFVFDMRSILNPGRIEEYKKMTGLDQPVKDFLFFHTQMNIYLNSAWDIIDMSVENYIHRKFSHLLILFGCTGGQHRSVFAAEETARHLRNKYNTIPTVVHTNKENWYI